MKRATKKDFAELKKIKRDLVRIGKQNDEQRKRLGIKVTP